MGGEWSELRIVGQALAALVLGGLLGWERESAGKWAGLRTHMLVCLAAFLFVKMGELMVREAQDRYSSELVRADPVRTLEAIVTGVSFIGAGTVFRDRNKNVARGLTTAASLLMVTPIGVAVALEKYVLAVGTTLLVLLILRGVLWLELEGIKGKPIESDPSPGG